MKQLPVAVCLGQEDLDFTLRLKLGRSDAFLLILLCGCSYFKAEKRKTHWLQKPY